MRMTVADLMCEMPVTVRPECTTDEALETFFEYEASELYVVDRAGRLLGVLPDYELLKAQLSGEARGATVEDLMSRSVPVVSLGSDAAEVARSFRDCQCSRMPVIKSGRLVGVVTRSDIMRLMAVLRRIDPVSTQEKVGPKRPKHLNIEKSPATRSTRGKSMTLKSTTSRTRSKPATRRSTTRTSR